MRFVLCCSANFEPFFFLHVARFVVVLGLCCRSDRGGNDDDLNATATVGTELDDDDASSVEDEEEEYIHSQTTSSDNKKSRSATPPPPPAVTAASLGSDYVAPTPRSAASLLVSEFDNKRANKLARKIAK